MLNIYSKWLCSKFKYNNNCWRSNNQPPENSSKSNPETSCPINILQEKCLCQVTYCSWSKLSLHELYRVRSLRSVPMNLKMFLSLSIIVLFVPGLIVKGLRSIYILSKWSLHFYLFPYISPTIILTLSFVDINISFFV